MTNSVHEVYTSIKVFLNGEWSQHHGTHQKNSRGSLSTLHKLSVQDDRKRSVVNNQNGRPATLKQAYHFCVCSVLF